jgi:hypothetical protein
VKQAVCPLCPSRVVNTVSHLAFYCPSLEQVRREETVLSSFRNMCRAKGFSEDYVFELFANGCDWNENPFMTKDFLSRGADLKLLLEEFLSRW